MRKRPLCLCALALAAAVRIFLWYVPSPSAGFEALDGTTVRLNGTVCAKDGEAFWLEHISEAYITDGAGASKETRQAIQMKPQKIQYIIQNFKNNQNNNLLINSQTNQNTIPLLNSQQNQNIIPLSNTQTNQNTIPLSSQQINRKTIQQIGPHIDFRTVQQLQKPAEQKTDKQHPIKKVLCRGGKDQPALGARVTVQGRLRYFRQPGTPGAFDERAYYDAKGISFALERTAVIETKGGPSWREGIYQFRKSCAALLEKCFPEREASVMKAMLLGEKQDMDREIKGLYQENGIAHVLAVSGLHISFLGMLLYRLFGRLGLGKRIACLPASLAVISYVVMIGFTPSSVRALIMFLFYLGAAAAGRTYDRMTALGAAAAWILARNPFALLDAGFVLSFGAVLGIELAVPWAAGKPEKSRSIAGGGRKEAFWRKTRDGADRLRASFLSGAAVSLFTLPAVLWYFYEFPLYAVLLNLLVIPLMGVLLPFGFGALLLCRISVRAALLCSLPAQWILRLFEQLCRAGESLPWLRLTCGRPAPFRLVLFYALVFCIAAAACSCKLPRFPLWCGFLSAVCLLTFRLPQGLTVTMLDVGQGDCFVLTEGDSCFLVDGGSSSQKSVGEYIIGPYLKYSGISRVDCVFISHLDEDHYNGILELLEKGKPEIRLLCLPVTEKPEEAARLIQAASGAADTAGFSGKEAREEGNGEEGNGMEGNGVEGYGKVEKGPAGVMEGAALRSGGRVCFLGAGDRLEAGKAGDRLKITCLYPEESTVSADRNDSSEVLLVEKGTFRMLFTGDLGEEGERRLLETGRVPACQVLKVGHHGSASSTGRAFLQAVSPQVALISCAEHNSYGHPAPETLQRLEALGVRFYVSKDSGTVRLDAASPIDVTETLCHDKYGGKGLKQPPGGVENNSAENIG